MIQNITKQRAYSGKYVEYENKTYYLVPEVNKGGCKGCELLDRNCNSFATDYCRQGYIFKEVRR